MSGFSQRQVATSSVEPSRLAFVAIYCITHLTTLNTLRGRNLDNAISKADRCSYISAIGGNDGEPVVWGLFYLYGIECEMSAANTECDIRLVVVS